MLNKDKREIDRRANVRLLLDDHHEFEMGVYEWLEDLEKRMKRVETNQRRTIAGDQEALPY